MSLREAGKEERRQRILAAAAAIVETDGLDGLTMRRLSDDAGVSYATVYNLIGAKEDVLVALLQAGLAELAGELASLRSQGPLERSKGVVAGLVDHFVGRPALYRPLVQAVHDPALGARGLPIRTRTIALHEASAREAIDLGLLTDELDPHVLGRHVTLAVNGAIQRWAAGITDDAAFRADADYSLRVALLTVATPETRGQLLTELRRSERRLAELGRAA
jgi:AcrR family transcriptional regulator